MAEIKIDGRMKVKTLQAQFKETFGTTLRVYKNTHFADGDLILAAIREGEESTKVGELACDGNMIVSDFEKKVKEIFGITVQVANPDNTKLVDNNSTLAEAGKK